jgi:hypothetical protein
MAFLLFSEPLEDLLLVVLEARLRERVMAITRAGQRKRFVPLPRTDGLAGQGEKRLAGARSAQDGVRVRDHYSGLQYYATSIREALMIPYSPQTKASFASTGTRSHESENRYKPTISREHVRAPQSCAHHSSCFSHCPSAAAAPAVTLTRSTAPSSRCVYVFMPLRGVAQPPGPRVLYRGFLRA